MEDSFFDVALEGLASGENHWTTSCRDLRGVPMAVPPEFDGPGGAVSPEDMFAMSLINCFAATFKVIAEKSAVTWTNLKVTGRLFPGRDGNGRWIMKKIVMNAELTGVSDADKGRRLLEKASGACMILNSTITEKEFHYTLN